MKIDLNLINKEILEGNIYGTKHDKLPLIIYNYTRSFQYENKWNNINSLCRALVLDNEGNVVANSIPKFFNIEEHIVDNIYNFDINIPYEVFEKLDGSYIQLFNYNDKWIISSKSSFYSDVCKLANEIFKNKYEKYFKYLDKNNNYIFELIHPENVIVCNYGYEEELYLLAVRSNLNNKEIDISNYKNYFKLAPKYKNLSFSELKNMNTFNKEGFVLKFENNFRVKIKFKDYIELHKIITNISSYNIYEFLKDKKDINVILENCPDEFDKWVKNKIDEINNNYKQIENRHKEKFQEILNIFADQENIFISKKDFYNEVKNLKTFNLSLLYRMFENKNYENLIWQRVKPIYEKPKFI